MNTPLNHHTDERLQETARRFRYPPTPDVTVAVMSRIHNGGKARVRVRSAWAIASLVLLLLVILFAVPGVRAEIVRFLQVGAVRVFPAQPTPATFPSLPQVPMTATPATVVSNTETPQPGFTPYISPAHLVTFADIAGETTLEAAQARSPFPIRLPAYPADLGLPDKVFMQEDGPMVILVWSDAANPDKARLSLHEVGPGSILVRKFEPHVIRETQVNGQYAVWAEGPYLVQLTNGNYDFRRTVQGNTLIWQENEVTYRLETDLNLEEAVRIAESLE